MRLLIVDDDVMIADLLASLMQGEGHDVCGVAMGVAEAVRLARLHRPDVAILDVMLRGELGTDIPHRLAEAGDLGHLGILYVTGAVELLRERARIGHACLQKPYTAATMTQALSIVRSLALGGTVSGALPYGMELLELHETGTA